MTEHFNTLIRMHILNHPVTAMFFFEFGLCSGLGFGFAIEFRDSCIEALIETEAFSKLDFFILF